MRFEENSFSPHSINNSSCFLFGWYYSHIFLLFVFQVKQKMKKKVRFFKLMYVTLYGRIFCKGHSIRVYAIGKCSIFYIMIIALHFVIVTMLLIIIIIIIIFQTPSSPIYKDTKVSFFTHVQAIPLIINSLFWSSLLHIVFDNNVICLAALFLTFLSY